MELIRIERGQIDGHDFNLFGQRVNKAVILTAHALLRRKKKPA
jgi:hypothetical protein